MTQRQPDYNVNSGSSEAPTLEQLLLMETPQLMSVLSALYPGITDGENYLVHVPANPLPMLLVAHVDIFGGVPPQDIVTDKGIIRPAGPYVLGADDRAGIHVILTVMARLKAENRPQPYLLFTNYEETHGQGVKKTIRDKVLEPIVPHVHIFVQIDRHGIGQAVSYCCLWPTSAEEWVQSFGWEKSYGTYSDIADLMDAYKVMGVNLATGYYNEHTPKEYLALDGLRLCIERLYLMVLAPPKEQIDTGPFGMPPGWLARLEHPLLKTKYRYQETKEKIEPAILGDLDITGY